MKGGVFIYTEKQKAAIKHFTGPALVLAGPGSGKTTVITHRIAHLISSGVPPSQILTVSFTRASARDMKERFKEIYPKHINDISFSTIHSLSYSIIRLDNSLNEFKLISKKEKHDICKNIIVKYKKKNQNFYEYAGFEKDIFQIISNNKTGINNKEPDSNEAERNVFFIQEYARQKKKLKLLDYDDLILTALKMTEDKKFQKKITSRYTHVLVDEFQDVSLKQFLLLKKVIPNENFYAVGDEDQSIYGFRGADSSLMLDFENYFKNTSIYSLTDNFRSPTDIVEAASALIKNNKKRFEKKIKSMKAYTDKDCIDVKVFKSTKEELAALCQDIEDFTKICSDSKGAVLVRTNSSLDIISACLSEKGIKFSSRDPIENIFVLPAVRIVMSFIKVSTGCGRIEDFRNIIRYNQIKLTPNLFTKGSFGWDTMFEFCSGLSEMENQIYDLKLKTESINKLNPKTAIKFIRQVLISENELYDMGRANTFPGGYYEKQLDDFENMADGISSLSKLLSMEKSFARVSMESKSPDEKNANIFVSTIHSSKGLEYEKVWIPFVNEGNIPLKQSYQKDISEEERRLFYVAMTRAKRSLYISCNTSGDTMEQLPSRFLSEAGLKTD